jgi:hypothetical protein
VVRAHPTVPHIIKQKQYITELALGRAQSITFFCEQIASKWTNFAPLISNSPPLIPHSAAPMAGAGATGEACARGMASGSSAAAFYYFSLNDRLSRPKRPSRPESNRHEGFSYVRFAVRRRPGRPSFRASSGTTNAA